MTFVYEWPGEFQGKTGIHVCDLILDDTEEKAISELNEEQRSFVAVLSTEAADREKDIIRQAGWELENYLKNPVGLWAHGFRDVPIFKSLMTKVDRKKLIIKPQFTEEAEAIFQGFLGGFIKGFSPGFIPKETKPIMETIEHDDGTVDKRRIGIEFLKQELLEASAVPVPANPEALAYIKSKGFDIPDRYTEEDKAIGGDKGLPTDPKSAWDANAAIGRVRRWAGGPDKDKVDWNKYKKAFVWFDAADKQNFGAYKLPFADVIGGTLKATWGGVSNAMAAVQGARGGVAIPETDRKKAYNFLVSYYKKFDKEPPEYREMEEIKVERKRGFWFMLDDETEAKVVYDKEKGLYVIERDEEPVIEPLGIELSDDDIERIAEKVAEKIVIKPDSGEPKTKKDEDLDEPEKMTEEELKEVVEEAVEGLFAQKDKPVTPEDIAELVKEVSGALVRDFDIVDFKPVDTEAVRAVIDAEFRKLTGKLD